MSAYENDFSIPRLNTVTYGKHSLRYLGPTTGTGQKTPEICVSYHPTKSDDTSGLNYAAQLVHKAKKMAFLLGKIFFYLQTIRFVSFHTEDRKMLQAHFSDFQSITFGYREQLSIVLKENIGESLLSSNGGFYMLFRHVIPTQWLLLFVIQ